MEDLARLRLGHDIDAAVYRVRVAGGSLHFLKVREGPIRLSSLLVPRHLRDCGVTAAVAPIPTTAGRLWAEADGCALVLYPFISGATGMARGMTAAQWTALGAILRQIHAVPRTQELEAVMQRETFTPDGADTVRELDGRLPDVPWGDIRTLLARAERLGRELGRRNPPHVICHADIHTNNVLLDAAGTLWVVDWDDVLIAPKERDLMFVVGGGLTRTQVGPAAEESFLEGYGRQAVDPLALAYYRCARAISDIAYTGAQVALRPGLDAAGRQDALDRLMRLFLPGNIVDLALNPPPAR